MVKSCAFVALLYGDQPEFLVGARLLGHCLRHWCPNIRTRILLLARDSSFVNKKTLRGLKHFWKVRIVTPIVMPNATRTRRHAFAFTKLHALSVDARRVLFLDLDVLVRSRMVAELFDINAPAGLYHGRDDSACDLHHGNIINSECLTGACVNTGILRVDPADTRKKRNEMIKDLKERAGRITKTQATFLPENYFLTEALPGPWRHISPEWNWEVGPEIEIAPHHVRVHTVGEWAEIDPTDIVVFHFFGIRCKPWSYIDLSTDEVEQCLRQRFGWQDTHGRIAQVVSE